MVLIIISQTKPPNTHAHGHTPLSHSPALNIFYFSHPYLNLPCSFFMHLFWLLFSDAMPHLKTVQTDILKCHTWHADLQFCMATNLGGLLRRAYFSAVLNFKATFWLPRADPLAKKAFLKGIKDLFMLILLKSELLV